MDKVKSELKHYNSIKNGAISAFNYRELDKALDYIHIAASIAWKHHLGIWYDNELENLLYKIGKNLQYSSPPIKKSKKGKKNAYIATNISDIGGNPEVLKQWSKLLKSNFEEQDLYITHSYTSYTPITYSSGFLDDTELNVHEFSFRNSNLKRIEELIRALSCDSPDTILLFIEPSDVIAIPAIYALNKKPKVIFFNHADQSFWLGRNVLDYLIDQRKEGVKYSRENRHINNSYIVPITTDITPKRNKWNKWGIKENSTVSVSVGSFHKVLGDDQINYFDIIGELLNEFPDHYHIFITNPPSRDILEDYIDDPDIMERFIIDGPYS
ncbi:hypothetical protein, partial [Methanobacterium sp.]|uniref:hypothetical protein n=1 Tax=Methanobacterium sp. TaxID=2164 RepID=UPI003C7902BF